MDTITSYGPRARRVVMLVTTLICVDATQRALAGETSVCSEITTTPSTITEPGVYCLSHALSFKDGTGVAIAVSTGNVVIDLKGFRLDGPGPTSNTTGIGSNSGSGRNIVVRNGSITGFGTGIDLELNGQALVEDIHFIRNRTSVAIRGGSANLIRGNSINGPEHLAGSAGISVNAFTANEVVDNLIANVGSGIIVSGDGTLVEHNQIMRASRFGTAISIVGSDAENTQVIGNRISGCATGIAGPGRTDICRDNVILNTDIAIAGCVDAGRNFSR